MLQFFFDGTKCYNFIYIEKNLFLDQKKKEKNLFIYEYEYELLKCEKHYL